MPRKLRIHYCDAFYHVMLRGNYQQNIFYCKEDFDYFCQLLENVVAKYSCKVHLYCLMTNHVHLLVQVGHIPLSKIMQSISSRFARYNHKKTSRKGHLFQGRFKEKLVNNHEYLLELCYYIHANPINARMVKEIWQYPWTSHFIYMNEKNSLWVTTSHIKKIIANYFDGISYREFFERKRLLSLQKANFCEFDQNGMLIINNADQKVKNPTVLTSMTNFSLLEIVELVCHHMNIHSGQLSSSSCEKRFVMARCLITYLAHYHAGYFLKDIAKLFCRKADSVSETLHRYLSSERKRAELIQYINEIHALI